MTVRSLAGKTYRAIVQARILVFVLMFSAVSIFAQTGPEQGGNEFQLWTAGGHSVAGGRGNTGIWDAGLRYGWVISGEHGPGFLRGGFEYAIDAVPLYLIFQPANSAYGIGVNPLNLKWNFERHGRVVPYAELSGGLLLSSHTIPSFTSAVNFTPSAAFGIHILRPTRTWTVEARYLHISNAGLERFNPGLNTFEVHLGVGKFRK